MNRIKLNFPQSYKITICRQRELKNNAKQKNKSRIFKIGSQDGEQNILPLLAAGPMPAFLGKNAPPGR